MSQSLSVPASQERGAASPTAMSDRWFSILLIVPAMLVILVFALLPLAYALDVSFRFADLTRGRIGDFVGLDNYRAVLHDRAFWSSVGVTLKFTLTAVTLEMVLGIAIAFLIHGATAGKGIIRSLMILPLATSAAVTGLFWRYLYDTQFGLINHFLGLVGLPEPNWLGDYTIALWSVILFDVWQWTPFVALIALAGLQALPKEPFEAAELDGASTFRVLRTLTFPMLKPVLFLVLVLRTIDSVRLYDAVAVLTRGGPGTVTETMTFYLYRTGLKLFRMDYASTMAIFFLYAMLVASLFALRPLLTQFSSRASEG
ncbi:ABC transporter permease subunit [Sinorhizobium medicae]|uniref:ABC transporter permease n=3 Tax=Sinorhizobium medicae TaxID=110321 RepID=A0A508WWC0_9HYPH|nr:sugar ABC transporter permease [Sinorhizobium medicae]ABR61287.1 binding-protein-dependent transport systems inner membrane component [Sinorhizobium medicae WSM419]MDX0411296.1 ABC transporter permease subunit [Sinorhizobium medicae]MDX0422801.1 ABC transporter permease subunit [Sinorhizobium medicae]MDX0428270.1 ABC transporter permease subunit [Sinorhizobium medicae]MDX0437646.1 ABC transporter permease subunit [Sinorhizobium medicae]